RSLLERSLDLVVGAGVLSRRSAWREGVQPALQKGRRSRRTAGNYTKATPKRVATPISRHEGRCAQMTVQRSFTPAPSPAHIAIRCSQGVCVERARRLDVLSVRRSQREHGSAGAKANEHRVERPRNSGTRSPEPL